LRTLEEQPIDLVVLDMLMPVLDGEGVLLAMARRQVVVPVIIMSAHKSLEDRARLWAPSAT
jgi:DNA-binding response OmpR family regulator